MTPSRFPWFRRAIPLVVAVTLAASQLDRIFPMMSTPSGTIPPAKVFVIGAGVAGAAGVSGADTATE